MGNCQEKNAYFLVTLIIKVTLVEKNFTFCTDSCIAILKSRNRQ